MMSKEKLDPAGLNTKSRLAHRFRMRGLGVQNVERWTAMGATKDGSAIKRSSFAL